MKLERFNGSAFNDPLDALSAHLREAGVIHAVLDGRTNQAKRGAIAAQFKRGLKPAEHAEHTETENRSAGFQTGFADSSGKSPLLRSACSAGSIPVLLAGVECMAEGHNFYLCTNVIFIAYSWAFDKFYQAIKRIHRLTSPKPVNLYAVICDGSIDRKLESSIQEKGDAAELVLDGKLMGERTEEMNLADLLRIAQREFDSNSKTIDETKLDWPALRARLQAV